MSAPDVPKRPVPPGMIRIGRVAGSDVFVTSSWFLIAALIAWLMGPRVEQVQPGLGGWKYVVGVAFAVALYLAVLLHEASHAVMARRYGFRVESITLNFLGGATAIDGESRRPREEFWIAVVGPITSIGVGLAALGLWWVTPDGLLLLVIEGLAGANLVIGVLNLVPGLPLDGGRVLKAGIWAATGKVHSGTVAAAWGGRVVAVGVLAWAVVSAVAGSVVNPLLLGVIGVFLWFGASQALLAAHTVRTISEIVVGDLSRRTLAVPEDLPLSEAVRRAQEAGAGSIVTTTSEGRPVGVVDEQAVRATPLERQPWMPVSSVARSLAAGRTLPVAITGTELVEVLRRRPASEYVLLTPDGQVHGVLATADVLRLLRRK